ncbi:MAG: PP2C family protein-serine/threonine phosphatase [Planctomycetia bacterium]
MAAGAVGRLGHVSEAAALRLARLEAELARERTLNEAAYALHTTLDLDELLGLILGAARSGVGSDRGTVYLLSEDGQEIWSRVLQATEIQTIRLPVGRGIAGAAAATGQAIRLDDAYSDPRFDRSWDARTGYRTRTMLAVPIRNRAGKVVGVFQLINRLQGTFGPEDERFLEQLSVHAALAVENATLHASALERERQAREIALAQEIQRKIQPELLVREAGSIVAAGMNRLCEDASGDYYDLLDLPGGRLLFCVGDVSGHGLGSALVMAQGRAWLRAFARNEPDPRALVTQLNDNLTPDLERGKFMTLFLGTVDPATGEVAWANAGHPGGLLLRGGTGEVEVLGSGGIMLGVLEGYAYTAGTPVTLQRGDTLLLYTDGASEAAREHRADARQDEDMFGEERLLEVLRAHASRGPEALLAAVRDAVLAFAGTPHLRDDLTLLALQRR